MAAKMRVLVFPCGSEIGLELHRSLKNIKVVELFGISSIESNAGKYFFKNYFEPFPFITSPEFIPALNAFIEEHKIDVVIPANDDVVLTMARNRESINADLITSSLETCDICRNKAVSYKLFANHPIVKVPHVYEGNVPAADFPVFVKPAVGQGSKGARAINDADALQEYIKESNGNYVIMERLTGEEYTIDCYTDKTGELKFAGARVRNRTINGISADTFPAFDEQFAIVAAAINAEIELRGPWFFQLKRDKEGTLKLLEISPRIAGSMALARNMGVNIPLLAIYELMGYPVNVMKKNYGIRLDRSLSNVYKLDIEYDTVYLDFDDCVILNGKVNIEAVDLIYQIHNEGKKVILVTRHKGNLTETLAKYRLNGLFNEICHLDEQDDKCRYINPEKAIFIDDSYRERKTVFDTYQIPVFDVCEIESLLNKKL
jgi:hypothetical protein